MHPPFAWHLQLAAAAHADTQGNVAVPRIVPAQFPQPRCRARSAQANRQGPGLRRQCHVQNTRAGTCAGCLCPCACRVLHGCTCHTLARAAWECTAESPARWLGRQQQRCGGHYRLQALNQKSCPGRRPYFKTFMCKRFLFLAVSSNPPGPKSRGLKSCLVMTFRNPLLFAAASQRGGWSGCTVCSFGCGLGVLDSESRLATKVAGLGPMFFVLKSLSPESFLKSFRAPSVQLPD